MIEIIEIKESEWGKTYGSCHLCGSYNIFDISLGLRPTNTIGLRLCKKHAQELISELKKAGA